MSRGKVHALLVNTSLLLTGFHFRLLEGPSIKNSVKVFSGKDKFMHSKDLGLALNLPSLGPTG